MPTPLKTLLQQLGLKKPEADVYLASLRLGEATAHEIAHEAKLPRTTAASILDRLKEEGFVTIRTHRGKRVYWVEDPHLLTEKERARLQVFEELAGRLHTEYHKADKQPVSEIYDTKEGIITLMIKAIEEMEHGGEMLVFESPGVGHYQAVMSDEMFKVFLDRKKAKAIRTRALIPSGHTRFIRPFTLNQSLAMRVLPEGLDIEVSMWIFGHSVVIFSGTHHFAVQITHAHSQESFRSLFEYLWKVSTVIEAKRTAAV